MMAADDTDRQFILRGIKEGFRVTNVSVNTPPSYQPNHPSATNSKNIHSVQEQIKTEIDNGRYVVCSSPPHIISALGALPKPDSQDIRLIHDASRPHGSALNDFAVNDKYACSTVETAAAMVTKGAYMGKVDLTSAYRSVKIHPADYQYAGLQWTYPGAEAPTYMYDTRLMFGARLSASTFNRLTQAVVRIMQARGWEPNIIVYCDDFFITHQDKEKCRQIMNELMSVLRALGFAINYKKVIGPSTEIIFLGVEINSTAHTLGLPQGKLQSLISEAHTAQKKKSLSKHELQSLCGKLSWAAQVIYGGRTHLRRLIDATNGLKRASHRTRITQEIRLDIQWWMMVAKAYNGRSPILDSNPIAPVCIDACLQGGGGYHAGEWFSLAFADWPGTSSLSINYKEVLSLLPATHIWERHWENKRVYVYSDNQAAVAIINRGAAKNPMVMQHLRNIYWSSVKHNYRLKALYYPGKLNVVADAASRLMFPNGPERLQAALNHTFVDHPHAATSHKHQQHGPGRAGQNSNSVSAAGVCEQHEESIRNP